MLLTFGIVVIGFVILVLLFSLLHWELKITIGIALALVVAAAIALASGGNTLANQLTIYAFGFLATGVVVLLIQYIKESR